MLQLQIGDTATIDLLNLFDWCAADQFGNAADGVVETEFGNILVMDDSEHVDLYLPNRSSLGAMDGETVHIAEVEDDYVLVADYDNMVVVPFKLSWEEAEAALV